MSIWKRIGEALSALTSGEPLSEIFDRLRTPPERSVAFTAIGEVATAVGSDMKQFLEAIMEQIKIGLQMRG